MEGAAAGDDDEGVTRFDAHGSAPPPPQKILAAYLVRLGLDPARYLSPPRRQPPGTPAAEERESPQETLSLLRLLHRAHACSIPFRSFPLGPGEGSLDIARVYRSVVQDRNGGTSFESNVMFAWALERILGCQVDFLEASLCFGGGSGAVSTHAHVCLLVHLDGQAWLADVAGGGLSVLRSADCFPGTPVEPLLFEAGLEQVQDSGHFRINRRVGKTEQAPSSLSSPTEPGTSTRVDLSEAEEPCEREEWVLQAAAPREASGNSPRAVAGPSGAGEAEPWDYPECSPGPASEPRASPLDPEEAREPQSPAAPRGPAPAPAPPWVDLFCFSSWPRGLQHLEEVHQASLEGAHKVAWRRRPPQEGGGRAILSQTEYLVVQDDGTIQEHEAVDSAADYFQILRRAFGICVPDSLQRPLPVRRDPPSAGRLPAAGAPVASPWQVPGEAGSQSGAEEEEKGVLLRREETPIELNSSHVEGIAASPSGGATLRGGSPGDTGPEEDGPPAVSSSNSLNVATPVASTESWFSFLNLWT